MNTLKNKQTFPKPLLFFLSFFFLQKKKMVKCVQKSKLYLAMLSKAGFVLSQEWKAQQWILAALFLSRISITQHIRVLKFKKDFKLSSYHQQSHVTDFFLLVRQARCNCINILMLDAYCLWYIACINKKHQYSIANEIITRSRSLLYHALFNYNNQSPSEGKTRLKRFCFIGSIYLI